MRLFVTVVFLMVLAWTRADPVPTASHHASEPCRSFDFISDTSVILGKLYFEAGFSNNTYTKSLLENTSSIWVNIIKTADGLHLTEYKKTNGKCVEIQFNATMDGDAATAHILGMETHIELRNFSKTAILMDIKASTSNIKSVIQKFKSDSHGHNDHAHGDHAHNDHAHGDHAHNDHAHNDHAHGDHAHNDHAHNDHAHNDHAHNASAHSASAHGDHAHSASAHDDHAHAHDAHDHDHTQDHSLQIHHVYLIGREHEVTKDDLEHFKEYLKCTEISKEPDFHFKSDQGYCSEGEATLIH